MEEEKKVTSENKNNLKNYFILGFIILVIVAAGALLVFNTKESGKMDDAGTVRPPVQAQTQQTGKQLFKDSNDYSHAYQIFPGTLSAQAKAAMSGFAMATKTLPDGSTQVSLSSTNPNYKNQTYNVKKGYTLYFIEKTLGDDNAEQNTDRIFLDDNAVLVDPNGFLAQ